MSDDGLIEAIQRAHLDVMDYDLHPRGHKLTRAEVSGVARAVRRWMRERITIAASLCREHEVIAVVMTELGLDKEGE